ncbi:variant erythrocyte surface antigen-1 family protein, partial [Babesia divergens]
SVFGGEALPSFLSVLRTLRSVLTGSLEPLRGTRMVCCMYYTDVFVGSVKIVNLNNALMAELGIFNNSDALTQLVHGLCLFMGYPSCLCKPKKSVGESLKKISGELKEELKNYKCPFKSISKPLTLNCPSCSSSDVVCKCCVLDCIREVQEKCQCVKGGKVDCSCSNDDGTKRCCKDLLEKLKASLSLLNLKADMENLCSCPENCCDNGECTQKDSSKCSVCPTSKTLQASSPSDYTVTGLGLLRPSPKRLAGRLETFFGDKGQPKGSCSCKCGTSGKSCCCLACPGECSQACSCVSKTSCKKPSQCPRKVFCEAIKDIKIAADSGDMKCCESGAKCHCEVDKKCTASSGSGQGLNCCIENSNGHYKHSVKCMILRLVRFFKDLGSSKNFFKSCCDLLCAAKTCYFLWDKLFKKDASGSEAQKFNSALEDLQYSSPCGQDLYRTLQDFLQSCFSIFKPGQKFVEDKVKAFQKSCDKCKDATTKGTSCSCCSSGSSYSCLACFALFNDYELKARFISEYSSSYTYKFLSSFDTHINATSASWKYLCRKPSPPSPSTCCCGLSSCPQCLSSSSCCQSQSSCDPSKCCPDCPQRKAAKIFLGMLPCLYYGLKIVFDRCDSKNSDQWPEWYGKNGQKNFVPASVRDASQLQNFLFAWGIYGFLNPSLQALALPGLLKDLFSPNSKGSFDKIYDLVSREYFSRSRSPSSGSKPPQTVREILIWLYGLRFQKSFPSLVSHCSSLCIPFGNSYNADAFCYYIHTSCFLVPVSVISFIQDSSSHVTTFFSTADSEFLKFSYPEDPSDLFNMLVENVRKIFPALKFLCIQCRLDKDSAGWKDCGFSKSCKEGLESSLSTSPPNSSCCQSSGSHGILCTSKPGHSNYHEHCTSSKPEVKCIGLQKCTDTPSGKTKTDKDAHTSNQCIASCPHPLLMFLLDGSESKSQAFSYSLFKLPKDSFVPRMGFSPDNLPSPGRNGHVLHDVLKPFCTNGFYPLTRLLKFLARISFHPPETLGEFFLFFKKLAEALNSKSDLSSRFVQWIEGEPGWYPATMLKTALEQLYGSKTSHSSSSHTPASLYSLNDCEGPRGSSPPHPTCGKYLHPLAQDASDNLVEDLVDSYLSWVCYLTPKFKSLLEEFRGKFSSCCQSSSCKKIVECPCALATLYSQGFVYYSPNGLNTNNKICSDFITQLGKVVGKGSPLQTLLTVIDEFIWHIRLPFIYAFLYIWILVISYFYYVQFYKLDLLHVDSHLHLPRSFKILPSTLFSDAS